MLIYHDFCQQLFLKKMHINMLKSILWHINVPKGSKGSMIEGYNVEGASESKLLLQRKGYLKMRGLDYIFNKERFEIWVDYISP